jgi:hypothetical protein
MKNEIQLHDIKFYVDKNIIYCKISSDLNKEYQKIDIEEIFYNGISILSNGSYLPIIIDLHDIGYADAIKVYKSIAHSQNIRGLILSQIFLVHSLKLKIVLSIYNFNKRPFFINKICNNLDAAIKYCNKDNMVFNSIRLND